MDLEAAAPAAAAAEKGRPPPVPGSSHGRRERLENMKQREELKDQLISKLRDRYSSAKSADGVSLASTTIRREVERFVGSTAEVTEANMTRLDRRLQRKAEGKPSDSDAASTCSVSAYTVGTAPSSDTWTPSVGSRAGSLTARRPPASGRGRGTPRSVGARGSLSARGGSGQPGAALGDAAYTGRECGEGPGGATAGGAGSAAPLEWAVLDKLAGQLHKQDAARQLRTKEELQRRMKADLKRQMADTQLKQEREREQDRKFHQMQVEATQEFMQRFRANEALRHEQLMLEKREQLGQLEMQRAQREEERRREKQEAEELVTSIHRSIESEKQAAERRHDYRRGLAQEALVAGIEASKIREEAQRLQEQREELSVKEYNKLRAERERGFKESLSKCRAQRETMSSVAAAGQEAAGKRETEAAAAKAAAEREERLRRDADRDLKSREEQARIRQQTQDFQMQQMQEKRRQREAEAEQMRQHRRQQDQQARNLEAAELHKFEVRRCRNSEHRAELERQIAAKTAAAPKDVMSEAELRLNKSLLERACQALTADELVATAAA